VLLKRTEGAVERNRELIAALIVVVLLTAIYLPLVSLREGRPSSLIGHGIGIAGFLLMLATETLYSLRKHSRSLARWGRMQTWLSAHIFMGIVGPYMVFLHTGWQFAGLAGVTMLMTIVVVGSGFIGRYIFTAVPRTPAGTMMEAAQLETAIRQAEAQLQAWLRARPIQLQALATQMGGLPATQGEGLLAVLGRALTEWQYKRRWRREVARLDRVTRQQADAMEQLVRRRRTLQRQMVSLRAVRRLMALWHAIHVPLGMVLFAAAFLHIVGALFYS
jgi:hypothetical protein